MTTAAETNVSEKEAAKEALKAREQEIANKEKEANASRTGKGLRVYFGMTRGRNPVMIQYENWDESQPDTLPLSLTEFMDLRKITEEKDIVKRLILGDNDILYSEASDPVAEFVEPYWEDDLKARFRVSVRNFAKDSGLSIEDAVGILKPAIMKANPAK
jgi:hypothetical protein